MWSSYWLKCKFLSKLLFRCVLNILKSCSKTNTFWIYKITYSHSKDISRFTKVKWSLVTVFLWEENSDFRFFFLKETHHVMVMWTNSQHYKVSVWYITDTVTCNQTKQNQSKNLLQWLRQFKTLFINCSVSGIPAFIFLTWLYFL